MKYMLPRLQYFMTQGAGMDAKGGGKGLKGVSHENAACFCLVESSYISMCNIIL